MVFKRFFYTIAFLVVLLATSIFLFFYSLEAEHLKFSVYGFAFLAFILMFSIIRLVHNNNRKIIQFLESYIVNEGSPKFANFFKDASFREIEGKLNHISVLYSKVKTDREAEHIFLHHLVDALGVGILVYDESGKITLVNKAFTRFLKIKPFNHIDLLEQKNKEIYELLKSSLAKQPTIIRLMNEEGRRILSVSVSRFSIKNKLYYLSLLQDVTNEISQEEVESWQKLIKILRHEIINSLTPVTTLTSTLIDNFDEADYKKTFAGENFKTIETNYKGLKAIEKRSEGLIEFLKTYQKLSATLKPKPEWVNLIGLMSQLKDLVKSELGKKNIGFNLKVQPKDAMLFIDEKQIMQVLLNFVKNAIEALENTECAKISVICFGDEDEKYIEVVDNGVGIAPEEQEKIFIPFYSTKKNGSGIGLSLSKQIMHLHKGDIKVFCEDGKTVFRLEF